MAFRGGAAQVISFASADSVENGRVETLERRVLIAKLRDEEPRLNPKCFNGEHLMREQPKVEFRALRANRVEVARLDDIGSLGSYGDDIVREGSRSWRPRHAHKNIVVTGRQSWWSLVLLGVVPASFAD